MKKMFKYFIILTVLGALISLFTDDSSESKNTSSINSTKAKDENKDNNKEVKIERDMPYTYDNQNIFAKVLRNEIPCNKVLETAHSLAFHDINPAAPKHVLVIPKGSYVTYDHFAQTAPDDEITDFVRAIGEILE